MAISQDSVGKCSFIDVLEEAVLRKRPVAVKLRSGDTFIDLVQDVVTENHQDFAVFRARGRFKVEDIQSCTRAETSADIPLEPAPDVF